MLKVGILVSAVSASLAIALTVYFLLKDVPSLDDHAPSVCKGNGASINGEYLNFDQIPSNVLRVLKAANPRYQDRVAIMLDAQVEQRTTLTWHLRGFLLRFWIKQYSESDLTVYYLNRSYFGDGCYGIDAAAKDFFDKDVGKLDDLEMAELLVMLKSTNEYSIKEHPSRNKEKAQEIINQLNGK